MKELFSSTISSPVLSVEVGVVVHKIKMEMNVNYGNSIIVKTKSNLYYLVAHTQNLLVGKDQEVIKEW
jgi:murein DD-endopeptidase MepM/ murein hydrolase activator NlpD